MKVFVCASLAGLLFVPVNGQTELKLTLLTDKPSKNIVASYEGYDKGGNTSIAFDSENIYKWSGKTLFKSESWGYFDSTGKEIPYIKRDRDLGQTFVFNRSKPSRLRSITVQTGFGSNAVRPGIYRKNISLQIFEVSGKPQIYNNGSGRTMEAFHGFPHDRNNLDIASERDDYYTGETYKSIAVFSGATFPSKTDFGFTNDTTNVPPDHPYLRGRFLRFDFSGGKEIILEPGKSYAFLIMIDSIGEERGFALANNYYGSYADGHAIRRDGTGVFPPVPCNPELDFTHRANKKALSSAHFPASMNKRSKILPGTNGYPDVDTFRDLVFFIEAE